MDVLEASLRKCHVVGWSRLTTLYTARYDHASVELNGGLWVTGGLDGRNRLSSTEMVHGDGSVVHGAAIPSKRYGHCMVDLLDGRIMLIGGYPTFNEVWFYYLSSGSFVRGPSLKQGRYGHACTVFRSPMYHKRYCVLVAGGWYLDELRTVEVLDFSTPSAVWTESEYGFILIILMINAFNYSNDYFVYSNDRFFSFIVIIIGYVFCHYITLTSHMT